MNHGPIKSAHWKVVSLIAMCLATSAVTSCQTLAPTSSLSESKLRQVVIAAMAATQSRGMAVAVIENGNISFIESFGVRNGAGAPLETETVMYGASITKAVFAILVMQLVEEGKLDLDKPLANYLPEPLPTYNTESDGRRYAPWGDLAGDERWRKITARMVLTHSTGFANFAFVEPDGKLRIHFEPGSRYAYSGAGIMLLQFALERGLGLNVGEEIDRRIFVPSGMTKSSLMWRADFAANLADGFTLDGAVEPHDERSRVRAAGSMDTTIADLAKLSSSLGQGKLLKPASLAELTRPSLPIRSASQFPSLVPEPAVAAFQGIAAGLGVVTFVGPEGAGFYKGGHNDSTANTWVCVNGAKRCVVILSNDVRSEPAFPAIVEAAIGKNNVPWAWEYSGMTFWRAP
jgi:CubicO group peptidase (beta-lactamase class C family)